MTILVAFDSESGNTQEIGREIIAELENCNVAGRTPELIAYRIDPTSPLPPSFRPDLAFIGSYTWGRGSLPRKAREFAAAWQPACPVAVFGSGDTQWGDGYFCAAVDELAAQFKTPFPVFKQEQMPNTRQRQEIREWAAGVLAAAITQPAAANSGSAATRMQRGVNHD